MSTQQISGEQQRRPRARLRYLIPAFVAVPLVVVIVLGVVAAKSKPTLTLSADGLAHLTTPIGGGAVRVSAMGGRQQKDIPVTLRGDAVWPTKKVAPGARITVELTVKRPGWISWLSGSTERVKLTEVAPVASVDSSFVTHGKGQPVTVKFGQPVSVVGSGAVGSEVKTHTLSSPKRPVTLATGAAAGTVSVAAAVKSWEEPSTVSVTYFPQGKKATAVASPSPGTSINPSTPITLTFSKPVSEVLGRSRPPVSPRTPGVWHELNSHTIVFRPTGYGYGLGASVTVKLPAGVELVGAPQSTSQSATATTADVSTTSTTTTTSSSGGTAVVVGRWSVPQPSTEALQELLAELGYLPLTFTPSNSSTTGTTTGTTATTTGTTTDSQSTSTSGSGALSGVASTVAAEESLIVNPPEGTFSWRYPNTPSQLKALWKPAAWTELTKGAVMAFESTAGLTVDGIAGPDVWKALIKAAVDDQRDTFGYTFVYVSENLPENIHVWHNGKIVVEGPVNTGIAAAPTATGTFAVYEHLRVTTMSGLNPNGTPYDDPGIPYVSYFNGGDALHGFIRASYGFPQSLGCVEMPFSEAGQVWPYTPIGTIVQVNS